MARDPVYAEIQRRKAQQPVPVDPNSSVGRTAMNAQNLASGVRAGPEAQPQGRNMAGDFVGNVAAVVPGVGQAVNWAGVQVGRGVSGLGFPETGAAIQRQNVQAVAQLQEAGDELRGTGAAPDAGMANRIGHRVASVAGGVVPYALTGPAAVPLAVTSGTGETFGHLIDALEERGMKPEEAARAASLAAPAVGTLNGVMQAIPVQRIVGQEAGGGIKRLGAKALADAIIGAGTGAGSSAVTQTAEKQVGVREKYDWHAIGQAAKQGLLTMLGIRGLHEAVGAMRGRSPEPVNGPNDAVTHPDVPGGIVQHGEVAGEGVPNDGPVVTGQVNPNDVPGPVRGGDEVAHAESVQAARKQRQAEGLARRDQMWEANAAGRKALAEQLASAPFKEAERRLAEFPPDKKLNRNEVDYILEQTGYRAANQGFPTAPEMQKYIARLREQRLAEVTGDEPTPIVQQYTEPKTVEKTVDSADRQFDKEPTHEEAPLGKWQQIFDAQEQTGQAEGGQEPRGAGGGDRPQEVRPQGDVLTPEQAPASAAPLQRGYSADAAPTVPRGTQAPESQPGQAPDRPRGRKAADRANADLASTEEARGTPARIPPPEAPARAARKGEFSRAAIQRELIDWHRTSPEPPVESELRAHEADDASADNLSTHFGGKFPGEIRDWLKEHPEARFQFKQNAPHGKAEDVLGTLGADEYLRRIESRMGNKADAAAEVAARYGEMDPRAAFLAHLHETMPARSRERAPYHVIDKPSELPDGTTLKIHGQEFTVLHDGTDAYLTQPPQETGIEGLGSEGTTMPIHGIDSIPIDAGSLRLPKKDTRVSKLNPNLLGETHNQPITGAQEQMFATGPKTGDWIRKEADTRGTTGDAATDAKDAKIAKQYDEKHTPSMFGAEESEAGGKQYPPHMQALLEKAKQHDAKAAAQGFTISDVTPEGYGPTGPTEGSHDPNAFEHDTRVHKLRNAINEAETLLRGKVKGDKRKAIEASLAKKRAELSAIKPDHPEFRDAGPAKPPDPRVITPDTPNVTRPGDIVAMGAASGRGPGFGPQQHAGPQGIASRIGSLVDYALGKAKDVYRGVADSFRDDAPRTTRTAPDSADALHAHAAAKVWRATMARRIASEVIADLPESKRDTLGIMLVEDRLRGMRQAFKDAGDTQAAAGVGTMIGTPLMKDEAAYKAAWADPELQAAIERHKTIAQPELEKLHTALGGRMAAPGPNGTFVNLLGVDPNNPETSHLKSANPSPGENTTARRKGSVHNIRATGSAESYSVHYPDIIDNGIGDNLNRVTLERFIKQAEKDGIAVTAEQGKKFTNPEGKPSVAPFIDGKPAEKIEVQRKGIPTFDGEGEVKGARTYVQNLWVRRDLAPEIKNALTLRNENTSGLGAVVKPLTWLQTKLGVDAAYHVTNDIAAIANSPGGKGMIGDLARKFPGINVADAVTRIGREYQRVVEGNTQVLKELESIASIGALRDNGKDSGFVAKVDQASRLALNGMWDQLVKEGLAKDTDAGRRSFINQVGQYNARMQPRLVRIARDLGLSPFVTAGRTFNRLGVRAVKGAIGLDTGLADGEAASGSASAQLRLRQTAGALVGSVALPAIWNWLMVGNPLGRPGVPVGAIDTGRDHNEKPIYVDPLKWTGLRRGLRVTGAGKAIEGIKEGRSLGSTASDSMDSVLSGVLSPYAGPPVAAASMMLAGQTPWGYDKADLPPPGGNKYIGRLKGALQQLNPTAGPFLGGVIDASTSDKGTGAATESAVEDVAKRFLGAAGVSAGSPPNERAREAREYKDFRAQERRKARAGS